MFNTWTQYILKFNKLFLAVCYSNWSRNVMLSSNMKCSFWTQKGLFPLLTVETGEKITLFPLPLFLCIVSIIYKTSFQENSWESGYFLWPKGRTGFEGFLLLVFLKLDLYFSHIVRISHTFHSTHFFLRGVSFCRSLSRTAIQFWPQDTAWKRTGVGSEISCLAYSFW